MQHVATKSPLSYSYSRMAEYTLNTEHPSRDRLETGGYSSSCYLLCLSPRRLRSQDYLERNLAMRVAAAPHFLLRPSIESTSLAPGPPAPCSQPPGPTGAALNPRALRTAPPPSYSPRPEDGPSVGREFHAAQLCAVAKARRSNGSSDHSGRHAAPP
eukprot:scaffold77118_cov57-Phaeocystis_antarctica.AAC.2